MYIERRTHQRHSVITEAVTMIFPNSLISTFVIDISEVGLAFAYTGWENWTEDDAYNMDFFDGETFIESLPVKIVSDINMGNPDGMPLRRVGVKFRQLSPEQTRLIRHYISNYSPQQEGKTVIH